MDLVADIAQADGAALANGVGVDDHLDSPARIAVDGDCKAAYERWRARHASSLTLEGVDLTHVWEVELIAQCFLPAARLRHGLPMALAASNAEQIATLDVDDGVAGIVAAIAEPEGVRATTAPAQRGEHERIRRPPRRLGAMVTALGLPPRVRGESLCVPYWHLSPLVLALAQRGTRITGYPLPVGGIGRHRTAAIAARGGWAGMPGPRARAASRAAVSRALADMREPDSSDPLEAAIDRHARETLARLAPETLAHVRHARRSLVHSRIRLGVLPFDSPEQVRVLLPALRDLGARTLLIQHGFCARMGDPDMLLANHVALWSERDRSLVPAREPASITISGNPGLTHLANPSGLRASAPKRSIVMVDYPARLSALIDSRLTMRHVATALAALARMRTDVPAVIRPHPSDLYPDSYAALAAKHPGLRVTIDSETPIETLLEDADLCIGSLSTAALQACVRGIPTVFLDTAGIARPWPFHGSPLPVATSSDGLCEVIARVSQADRVGIREAATTALGIRLEAVDCLVDLIGELSCQ